MAARQPYTVISRAVHIHPTVTELIPTLLQQLKPGGRLPLLAGLSPLIAREWLSPHGYRSGNPDMFALAQAYRDARAAAPQGQDQ